MSGRRAVLTALLSAGLITGAAPDAGAKPSVVSGIAIPFPVVDLVTGCASTARLITYPDITAGAVASESITARVESPVCDEITWTVDVTIIDNSPGFEPATTAGHGTGKGSASAFASQLVTYANPQPVRGAATVTFRITWVGSNGVRGCVLDKWVVSHLEAVEVAVAPCDDRISLG